MQKMFFFLLGPFLFQNVHTQISSASCFPPVNKRKDLRHHPALAGGGCSLLPTPYHSPFLPKPYLLSFPYSISGFFLHFLHP